MGVVATATMTASARACPACGSAKRSALPHYSFEQWSIVQCGDCDFVYLGNPPGYAALVDDFAFEKTFQVEKARRLKTRPIAKRLSDATRWRLNLRRKGRFMHLFNGGKVLDIGCGKGTELYMQGVTPFGIEISRDLAVIANERMKKHGGYAIQAPAVEGLKRFDAGMFDGVIMNSYLEHEENPREALDEVARVLRPGGKAYVRVPNFGGLNRRVTGKKWCGFRYPDHVNYFTLSGLRAMARKSGFSTSLVNWLTLPTDDNIKMVLTRP